MPAAQVGRENVAMTVEGSGRLSVAGRICTTADPEMNAPISVIVVRLVIVNFGPTYCVARSEIPPDPSAPNTVVGVAAPSASTITTGDGRPAPPETAPQAATAATRLPT